jgi:hypothetical protein
MGPSGFDAYARLRFLPDPLYNGQPEITLDNPNAPSEHQLLQATLEVLAKHTTTADEVYFCLWAGWGSDAFPPSVLNGARVAVSNRDYFMLLGNLSDFGEWHILESPPGQSGFDLPDPAFIWPDDHAWCIANDVDPHYAGIGATSRAVEQLLADPNLDVVRTDPGDEPPFYY